MTRKMKQQHIEQPPRKSEERAYGRGKEGIVFCRICNAVYYKKAWHHNLRRHKNLHEDVRVTFEICPACTMIKNKKFEGRITLFNIPPKVRTELTNLATAFCHRAYQIDPMDRLIEIKTKTGSMEITTTENQLAVKLAKKIGQVFKKTDIAISYAHATDKATDIIVTFA